MIVSFKNKALKLLWYEDDSSKINAAHLDRILNILTIIDGLEEVPKDLQFYSNLRPHPYKGSSRSTWSLDVSGNYRITFRFENKNAYDIDYIDPH